MVVEQKVQKDDNSLENKENPNSLDVPKPKRKARSVKWDLPLAKVKTAWLLIEGLINSIIWD